jgi:hypothetical protein
MSLIKIIRKKYFKKENADIKKDKCGKISLNL